jgi:UDP-galactopyranose mutase
MLLCFSHLRWDFVWQRPQHLMSRFAKRMPVYVVEEPVQEGDSGTLRIRAEGGVTVVTPVLPAGLDLEPGFNRRVNRVVRELLTPLVRHELARRGGPLVAWYYTPMALGAAPTDVEPDLVVFDAMDELAAFRFAPPELHEREAALMRRADLVFTGGPSLYRARKHRHPSVHCFPSGVEAGHFAQARGEIAPPDDLAARPQPVLGFYGVLDERVDMELLAGVADLRPDWTVALVGPVAKIGEEDLPQRPNVVRFGKQAYADLPRFLAGFDVALLPFARNEATRFISPTKTLEYMAGGKPIVSTPITDVVDLYGEVVSFGETADEFVRAAEALLAESPGTRRQRQARAQRLLAQHAWDAIAARMLGLMDGALAGRRAPLPFAAALDEVTVAARLGGAAALAAGAD